jgi:hypothetical protein
MVIDGCMENLGVLKNKNLTVNFIVNYGVWIRKDDTAMLDNHYPGINSIKTKIINYLSWPPNTKVRISPKGLTLNQIRFIASVKDTKFNKMTTDQLTLLRNRILIDIEDHLKKKATFWSRKINEIKAVAEKREITLSTPSCLPNG